MFTIEKDVPYDNSDKSGNRALSVNVTNTCIHMKVGESFVIPADSFKNPESKQNRPYIKRAIKEKLSNWANYRVSILENGSIRVWLIK